jgi:hypothetical protein
MNTPVLLVILAAIAVILLLVLLRFYLQRNRRDLQKLKSELKDSNKE